MEHDLDFPETLTPLPIFKMTNLSRRDMIAALMMQEFANPGSRCSLIGESDEECAIYSVKLADTLIKELDQNPNPKN